MRPQEPDPEDPPARRPAMLDVARRAGVSGMTVSRVLRGAANVAPQTALLVHQAARDLGYVPDLAATSLAHNRSRTIGVIVPTLRGAIFADAVQGMTDRLRPEGYQLILGCDGYDPREEERLVGAFIGRRVEALVLTSTDQTAATIAMLRRRTAPIVQAWELAQSPLDISVGLDNFAAVHAMTVHLVARGYRRIALVYDRPTFGNRVAERISGYRAALSPQGIPPILIERERLLTMAEGATVVAELHDSAARVDALLLLNDHSAAGALFEATRRGIAVPGRLGIACFGYTELVGQTNPGLTSISTDGRAMGGIAIDRLFARLRGEAVAERRVDVGFVIEARGST